MDKPKRSRRSLPVNSLVRLTQTRHQDSCSVTRNKSFRQSNRPCPASSFRYSHRNRRERGITISALDLASEPPLGMSPQKPVVGIKTLQQLSRQTNVFSYKYYNPSAILNEAGRSEILRLTQDDRELAASDCSKKEHRDRVGERDEREPDHRILHRIFCLLNAVT